MNKYEDSFPYGWLSSFFLNKRKGAGAPSLFLLTLVSQGVVDFAPSNLIFKSRL